MSLSGEAVAGAAAPQTWGLFTFGQLTQTPSGGTLTVTIPNQGSASYLVFFTLQPTADVGDWAGVTPVLLGGQTATEFQVQLVPDPGDGDDVVVHWMVVRSAP